MTVMCRPATPLATTLSTPSTTRASATVAEASGAGYVDTIPWFCTDTVCPAVIAGLTTHRDAYHVAENYVVWLAGVLGESIGVLPHRIVPPHA